MPFENGIAFPMASGESIIDRWGTMLDAYAVVDLAEPGTFGLRYRLRRLGCRRCRHKSPPRALSSQLKE